jgi:Cys-rich repeat protein
MALWGAAAIMLACASGCDSFGTSVVGGDATDDVTASDKPEASLPDVPGLDADVPPFDRVDADDVGDAGDMGDRADVIEEGDVARCMTNADCTDPSRPVCETVSGRCVQCVPSNDTCARGQYCNAATFTCEDGCRTNDDCVLPSSGDGGASRPRYCNVPQHQCVECLQDSQCPTGQFCQNFACGRSCSPTTPCPAGSGLSCCGATCVDVRPNEGNCGACGTVCRLPNATPACRGGMCAVGSCTEPFGNCDGNDANGCELELRSVTNCGRCGNACPVPPNAAPTCDRATGTCGYTCNPGFADCNRRAEDGCEVDTGTSAANCGACGNACRLPNATAACSMGRCTIGMCNPNYADCDGVASNGCEVDLRATVTHCGTCNAACPGRPRTVPACVDGSCRYVCEAGFAECNGVDADGCEVDIRTDGANCGGCGRACRPLNGAGRCTAGACVVTACEPGFADCNMRPEDGCEVSLNSDARNCGTCGTACPSGQVCQMGRCSMVCMPPQTLCGTTCTTLATDANNCGACGRACPTGQVCIGGACQPNCGAGETNCSGVCVNTITNVTNCGRCGNACPRPANAAPTCAAGACGYTCNTGFADCNRAAVDGCEVNIDTDARNCGGCGTSCMLANATSVCAAGRCAVGMCNAGFANCDGNPANGCEVNTNTDARNCGMCGRACPTGNTCVMGMCTMAPGGTTVTGPTVINVPAAPVIGMAGQRTVMLVQTMGTFVPGQRVILHQTQSPGADAGRYEFNRVTAVSGQMVQLETPLAGAFTTDATRRAQIVVVQEYAALTVAATGSLTAPAWNGQIGGILAVEVAGDASILGSINMDGRGFRGPAHPCQTMPTLVYRRCSAGQQGESYTGVGTASTARNGGGGGGGGQGQDCGAGGGGAYGTAGTNGAPGDCNGSTTYGECAPTCPNPPGIAGTTYGAATLGTNMFLGSGGGEGGADEDGANPGPGGNGGGLIFLRAGGTVTVSGILTASGVDGGNGDQFSCGGRGCGQGGGGGGSGGAIRLLSTGAVTFAASAQVRALGGGGGLCSCRTVDIDRSSPAGRGGVGRIGVQAPAVNGTSNPAFNRS